MVKMEGVQVKVEPSIRLRSRDIEGSSPAELHEHGPETSLVKDKAGPVKHHGAPATEGARAKKRRRKSEEPRIRLEHDVEPKVKTEFDVEPKVEVKGVSITPETPFPGHMRPSPEECRVRLTAVDSQPHIAVWATCRTSNH